MERIHSQWLSILDVGIILMVGSRLQDRYMNMYIFGPYVINFGPSGVRASAVQTKVATILGIFLFSFLSDAIQNHRRDCPRILNFCMGS